MVRSLWRCILGVWRYDGMPYTFTFLENYYFELEKDGPCKKEFPKSTSSHQFLGVYTFHGPPKPTCLEVFMVNNLAFRWPKPLFFMVLGLMV